MAGPLVPAPDLHTRRLVLRPLGLDDAEPVQRLFPHWPIVRYLNARVPWPYPTDGALTHIRDVVLPAMEAGRAWHWSLRLRETPGDLIGAISLMDQKDDNRGFWIGLPWQGRGLMTEACEIVTEFWFEALRRDVLRVPKAAANLASRRISERSGMRLVHTEMRNFVSGPHLAEIWEITRAQWSARRPDRGR